MPSTTPRQPERTMASEEGGVEAPALRAFACTEEDEHTGGIVFARHDIVARREASGTWGSGEFYGWSVRRAPWADACAESSVVPASLMVEHGWYFECCGCGERIDEDFLADRGLLASGVIGHQHGRVYCRKSCKLRHERREKRKAKAEAAAIKMMRGLVHQRFPGISFVTGFGKEHAYCIEAAGGWAIKQTFVSFEFPGMKIGPASLRYEAEPNWRQQGPTRPEFSCCFGDKEAFEAEATLARTEGRTDG